MADTAVSVVVKGKTTDDRTTTTTISYVNPEASNAQLYELGYKISTFTTATDTVIRKVTEEILLAEE